VFSPLIIEILGGYKYVGAEKILPLLLFAGIPLSLINFSNLGAAYAKKSIISTITLFIGLVIVLALNFIITPLYLQYGAAAASLTGHVAIIVAGYLLSRKYYPIRFNFVKDAFVFFAFLFFSILSVNTSITGYFFYEMLLKAIILAFIVIFFTLLQFKQEYRKVLDRLRVR
jgi:O-antigen/teichoic acid export membrane protein